MLFRLQPAFVELQPWMRRHGAHDANPLALITCVLQGLHHAGRSIDITQEDWFFQSQQGPRKRVAGCFIDVRKKCWLKKPLAKEYQAIFTMLTEHGRQRHSAAASLYSYKN